MSNYPTDCPHGPECSQKMKVLLIRAVVSFVRIDQLTPEHRACHGKPLETVQRDLIEEIKNFTKPPIWGLTNSEVIWSKRKLFSQKVVELYKVHEDSAVASGRNSVEFKQHLDTIKMFTEYLEGCADKIHHAAATHCSSVCLEYPHSTEKTQIFSLKSIIPEQDLESVLTELPQHYGQAHVDRFFQVVNTYTKRICTAVENHVKRICMKSVDGVAILDSDIAESIGMLRQPLNACVKEHLWELLLCAMTNCEQRSETARSSLNRFVPSFNRVVSRFFSFESPAFRLESNEEIGSGEDANEGCEDSNIRFPSQDLEKLLYKENFQTPDSENTECAICREAPESLCQAVECKHVFCAECLRAQCNSDLENKHLCGVCRGYLFGKSRTMVEFVWHRYSDETKYSDSLEYYFLDELWRSRYVLLPYREPLPLWLQS